MCERYSLGAHLCPIEFDESNLPTIKFIMHMTQEERDNVSGAGTENEDQGENKGEHRGDKADQGEGQEMTEEERRRQYLEESGVDLYEKNRPCGRFLTIRARQTPFWRAAEVTFAIYSSIAWMHSRASCPGYEKGARHMPYFLAGNICPC
jgi:hypothetical protein